MPLRRLTLVLEYFHDWPNSAGFQVARAHGWYANAGIDLQIRTVDPYLGDSLEHLERGLADIAVFPGNRLLVRREAGLRPVALAAVNQRGLETVRTMHGTGITRLAELAGHRVAYNPTPRGRAVVRTLVARDGGDPDAVIEVDAGTRELDPAPDAAGRPFGGIAHATFGSYWAWDNLLTSVPADQQRVWRVDEHLGVPYHSYLLGVHERALADADVLAEFVAVTARGYRAAAEDPEHAAGLYEQTVPFFPRHVLRRSVELVATSWFHEGEWGSVRPELVGPYAHWMAEHGILTRPGIWPEAIASLPALIGGTLA